MNNYSESLQKEISAAMFSACCPSNALPFLIALVAGCKENGNGYMSTSEAKRILWVINTIAYHTSLAVIDQADEWDRLHKEYNEEQKQAS